MTASGNAENEKGRPNGNFRADPWDCLGSNVSQKRVRKGLRWVCLQPKEAAANKDKIESLGLEKNCHR